VSEFIWAMGRELDHTNVYVPLPAYTDYLKAFPGRAFSLDGEQIPTVEQVNAALDAGGLVIISNPHNSRRHPGRRRVVRRFHPGSDRPLGDRS
jgi:hypothetical protein